MRRTGRRPDRRDALLPPPGALWNTRRKNGKKLVDKPARNREKFVKQTRISRPKDRAGRTRNQGNEAIFPVRSVTGTSPSREVVPPVPVCRPMKTPSDESLNGAALARSLPHPNTKRWVVRRKAAVVAAVRSGGMTMEEACRVYQLSEEEFLSWQRAFEKHGLAGLRATRIQQYRASRPARAALRLAETAD